MITYSQIQLSEIELGRMDPEYYRPDLVMLSKSISNNPNVSIRRAGASIDCSAFYPSIVPYYDFNQNGVPFLRVNEIQNGLLSIGEKTAFLPEEILQLNRSTIATCEPGDLIIAKGGNSLGKVALLTSLYPKYSVCRDVLVVRTGNLSQINRFFLWLYLHSASGQSLLIRTASQTGQPHLTIESIARLKIPLIPNHEQEEIERSYLTAEAAMERSCSSYTQAQQLLESELGLDKLSFQKQIGYTAQLSELEISRRTDADFFNPKLRYYRQELEKRHSLKQLTHFAKVLKFSNPSYADNGIPIITQKHLGKIAPDDYGDDLVAQSAWVRSNPLAMLRRNDLLYYSVGAYLGKTNLWLSDHQAVNASFITMLRCYDEADAGFIQVLLNSSYGILQSKCFQSGTAQPYIYPKDIRRFLIPDVSTELKQEINTLVTESYQKSIESKLLLEQAKTRVEQLIEEAVQS